MARIRTIKPEFWTSEQVVECSPTAPRMRSAKMPRVFSSSVRVFSGITANVSCSAPAGGGAAQAVPNEPSAKSVLSRVSPSGLLRPRHSAAVRVVNWLPPPSDGL